MWLLLPFVVCGLMLAIGLLVSVLYTSINFFIDGFVIHGCIFLILGLITFGKNKKQRTTIFSDF